MRRAVGWLLPYPGRPSRVAPRTSPAGLDRPAPELLEKFLQDHSRKVVEAAVDHPNLPAATRAMWQLAHILPQE